ncbi:cytochrome P450 [Viridothelium virens]|uniref:Cytochrome P450 n=1 Tax=Viridothelium virens TaxID=1048519 RepID=A0A6A6HJD1_VIRVR|nr:cytochrome P450 [Viridothelium virens]
MALNDLLVSLVDAIPALPIFTLISAQLLLLIFTIGIYTIYFHPLSHIPGPLISKLTSLWIYYHSYIGDEPALIDRLHQIYGPIVRVCPNEVDISDGNALNPIYVSAGGFGKAPCYANYDIDAHPTIFSALNLAHRSPRAKAVLPLFAPASIRASTDVLEECVERFVERLKLEARSGKPVNVLNLSRSLALDVVSAYLFSESYGGVKEAGEELSASRFVDAFVAVGRFFYLPTWAFVVAEAITARLYPSTNKVADVSIARVEGFVGKLVEEAVQGERKGSYQERMLKAGVAKDEVESQCKDVIFAGTDSTGMNLGTICWSLVQNPEQYEKLRREILEAKEATPDADPQTLPYLRAVVKEGLRVSMANPTRLPRIVPSTGWTFKHVFLPPGTIVSCQMYSLHFNPTIFPQPSKFQPERWLDPSAEMLRDHIPFGIGTRQCIARNLASANLFMSVQKIVEDDCLRGASVTRSSIERLYWFNSKASEGKIELVW